MEELNGEAERTGFSGVIRIDRDGVTEFAAAFGLADRAHHVPNTLDTRFAIASGAKGFTALTVVSLIQDRMLVFDTTARSVLGVDLPLIDDAVTVEQLLGHRSGIGDYLDESVVGSIDEYVMPVPEHRLVGTEDYLAVLDGHPMASPPGERFAYNNGGYVVLALIAERAGGAAFADLVHDRVCVPAGMTSTAFLRSDEPAGDVAVGYLAGEGPRTNVLHLPVVGSGDGGIYSTAADLVRFWGALSAGRIVSAERAADMLRPRGSFDDGSKRYGLGFHAHATSNVVWLEGYDAGVSFASTHDPERHLTHTVISNTSEGAWPILRLLDERLDT